MSLAVRFSFDPFCPWTWRTSRWLELVAPERDLVVEWRPFSLYLLSDGNPPAERRAAMEAAFACLRMVEALQAEGRNDDVGRLYTEVGTRVHEQGQELTVELVRTAAEVAGVGDLVEALDEDTWDDAVRRSHDSAFASAGPDIGSPVLEVEGSGRGLHGPILGEVPTLEQSLSIWDSARALIGCPAFFELKRGRR